MPCQTPADRCEGWVSLLVDEDKNTINTAWLAGIASDIARLKAAGKDVVVVSSGAIALGSRLLKIHNKTMSLQEKQAAAARASHAGACMDGCAWRT